VDLLKHLAHVDKGRFLAFSDSRKMVEQIVAATMRVEATSEDSSDDDNEESNEEDELSRSEDPDESRILPYRAGYESDDAKEIQSALWRGKLGGVVSTSAMELGLDIGEIDLVVLFGIPPSLKAFWQRLGRAGRKRVGICLVIDTKGGLTGADDSLAKYLGRQLEPSWLYLENRYLQYANVLCAALEHTELGAGGTDMEPFDTLPPAFRQRAFRLAYSWKLLHRVPAIKLLRGERQREFIFTPELEHKYLELAPEPLRSVFQFLIESGMRLSEALQLPRKNIVLYADQDNGIWGYIRNERGKTKYAKRTVLVTAGMREVILRWMSLSPDAELLFTTPDGRRPLSRHTLNDQASKVREKLGLPWDCVLHACRHTFGTRLGMAGADVFTIQAAMGHASVAMSQRYVHPTQIR
jgi:integrase